MQALAALGIVKTTNYYDTFITASPDCEAQAGKTPAKEGTIAARQHALLLAHPYRYTSDDLLFEVYAERQGIETADSEGARTTFFAKPQACLRTSPLVGQFGWGLHHDAEGKVAAYGVETERYRQLAGDPGLKVAPGMRRKRA
ncbi:MAG: DUF6157 family protein [Verrucomicrobiota bacterium JB022]|nr:DUF6157 family protein [Verrucomicrobiota bacterium JB022]